MLSEACDPCSGGVRGLRRRHVSTDPLEYKQNGHRYQVMKQSNRSHDSSEDDGLDRTTSSPAELSSSSSDSSQLNTLAGWTGTAVLRRFSSLSTDLKWANISSATAPAAAAASAIATSLPDLINTCMSPSYRTSASASSKLHEGTTAVFLAGGDSEYKTNAQLPGASLGGLPSAFWTDSTSEDATSCSTTANNDAGADVIGGSGSDQGQCHDTDASPDYLAGPAPGPAGPSRTAGKKMLATAAGMVNRSVNKIKSTTGNKDPRKSD